MSLVGLFYIEFVPIKFLFWIFEFRFYVYMTVKVIPYTFIWVYFGTSYLALLEEQGTTTQGRDGTASDCEVACRIFKS